MALADKTIVETGSVTSVAAFGSPFLIEEDPIENENWAVDPLVPPRVENLAKILEVPKNCVSVKATTHEGLGALGRSEGIASMAIVSLREISGE